MFIGLTCSSARPRQPSRIFCKLVVLLYARELALEDVDCVERSVGAHAALYGSGLLPLLDDVVDLVLNYLILRNNLKLQPRCDVSHS